nr:initiator tRNA phosphoribosyl transferase [Tanacetum cinerariifolium]
MIVDSTRKGKRFPDSMSKTIPIWTCVLNRAILNYRNKKDGVNKPKEGVDSSAQNADTTWDSSLHLPLWVPDTEKARIESKLDGWVEQLETSGADISSISSALKKPLRPLWISQKTVIWLNEVPDYNSWDFTPVILISASASSDIYRQKTSSEFSWNYIPGAGDDEESWARGLTPTLFWNNVYDLINSGPDVCNQKVAAIVEKDRVYRAQRGQNAPQLSVKPTKLRSTCSSHIEDHPLDTSMENGTSEELSDNENGIYWLGLTNLAVCATGCDFKASNVDAILNCDQNQALFTLEDSEAHLHLPIMNSKFDRFSLQRNLPSALNFAKLHLERGKTLAVCCNSGEDICVCVCLAILMSLFNVEGLDKSPLQTYSRSKQRTRMVVGESSQPPVKDTTLAFQCSILTSTNYTIWRMRMEVLLGIHGVWDVVDPGSDDAKKNNIVKGLLFQSIPEDLVLQIGNLKTGKEMWEAIKTRNLGADRVKKARLQTLITEFDMKMLDNGTIDEYAAKLSGIASKSATLGEVTSKHKLVKKFLTSLPRSFVHIVAALEQVLDLKTTGFEEVVGRLKAYEERVKEEDKANDPQENLLYARTEYSNGNNDSSGGRGRGSYTRGRGRGRGQGRGRDNSQNLSQRDSSKNREENEQKGKQHEKRDLSHIQCYRRDKYGHFVSKCPERNRKHEVNLNEAQEKGVYHEHGTFFTMNHIQETIFMNEEKYTPPKSESNTNDEDDVWYFDNGASNHMTGNYSYFSELNKNITGRVRFRDGSCVSIKGKGSILFQGKNGEQTLLKDVYYIPALRSNVISLGQATISGYDISIRGDLLTMRDNWGSLLIKVPRSANRLYKAQLKVGKEGTNEVGRESDKEENPHSSLVTSLVTVHETSPKNEKEHSRSDDMSIPIRLLIALAARKGWKIHHLDVITAFINGIEVSQGKDYVEIKQERYAMKILKKAGMEDWNATLCPMEPGLKLSKAEEVESKNGGLLTLPLAHSSRFDLLGWCGYSDSSHNVDIDDGRSTTGHVFYLGTSPITWCSQKQTTVALSSCEAEFRAATAAAWVYDDGKFFKETQITKLDMRQRLIFICKYAVNARPSRDTLVVGKVLELIIEDGPCRGLYLNVDKTEVFLPKEDPRSSLAGIFPPNIARPLHGVKLLGGPASVDFDFSSELAMKRVAKSIELMDDVAKINNPQCELLLLRACAGVSKLYFAIRTCSPWVFERAQRSFDAALHSALERIVTTSGPGFDDCQWRLATLPFAFGWLGVYSAGCSDLWVGADYEWVFVADIYEDRVVSCVGIVGIKHRHNLVRDTLVDICFWSGISAGSSPLTQTGMIDFVPRRAVIEAAQRKCVKYEAKCADIGYGFLSFSFSSFGELEKNANLTEADPKILRDSKHWGTRCCSHF